MECYKQTLPGSCGAACLLMVLNYFKCVELSKKNELEFFKRSRFFPLSFTNIYRLAILSKKNGLLPTIITKTKNYGKVVTPDGKFLPKEVNYKLNRNCLRYYKCAKNSGVKIFLKDASANGAIKNIKNDCMVIAFISGLPLGLKCMHAILLTDVKKNKVYYNDTLIGKNKSMKMGLFKKCFDTKRLGTNPKILTIKNHKKLI